MKRGSYSPTAQCSIGDSTDPAAVAAAAAAATLAAARVRLLIICSSIQPGRIYVTCKRERCTSSLSSSESDLLSLSTLDIELSDLTEEAGDMGGEGDGESCWQADEDDVLLQRGTALNLVVASVVIL